MAGFRKSLQKERKQMKKTAEEYREMFCSHNWTAETLAAAAEVTEEIAVEELGITTYPNQIEIVSSEQLIDAMSLVGLPVSYSHWSFGKSFVMDTNRYVRGQMGLSYEMVINSNPCISYNAEDNTTTLMVLVIAHACQGHNSFFKNNYMFKEWTDADAIIDYMVFARNYVAQCEERYGPDEVERTLDACHALSDFGVDKYKKPKHRTAAEEKQRYEERVAAAEKKVSVFSPVPEVKSDDESEFEPVENILYFIEKEAPRLESWKRELVRIVRKTAQYFYPQAQTKMINEGWATFVHYHIINSMYDRGLVDDGFMLEFIASHTGVIYQPDFDSKHYSGLNPYALGFAIFSDIKRMCQNPTEEDREWFPSIAGTDWVKAVTWAYQNHRDDSFVLQYLSPKVIRDLRLFSVTDNESESVYTVDAVHDEYGYRSVREALSKQYSRDFRVPDIQVTDVNEYSDRGLIVTHFVRDGVRLSGKDAEETVSHLRYLWGFPVTLLEVDAGDCNVAVSSD